MNNVNQSEFDREELRNSQMSLIKRAREGSAEAFDELKNAYKPLIESQVVKHTVVDMNTQDVEDLRQEALVIFCNSVCNYDCSVEGVEFGLYAKICIANGLASFVRAYVRRSKNAAVSLESLKFTPGGGRDMLQAMVDKENLSDLVHSIKRNLSDYENRVWWLYVAGISVADIAKTLGTSDAKSVSNAIYRIRKKLRAFVDAEQ